MGAAYASRRLAYAQAAGVSSIGSAAKGATETADILLRQSSVDNRRNVQVVFKLTLTTDGRWQVLRQTLAMLPKAARLPLDSRGRQICSIAMLKGDSSR